MMQRKLSKEEICSFCGNVVPLRLLGGTPYSKEEIVWRSDSDAVVIHTFEKGPSGFTDGVLLTLVSPGEALITASFDGKEYFCRVLIRERMKAESGRNLNYYIGDLHDHTTRDHNAATFRRRTEETFPARYLEQVRDENLLDFTAVSDHAELLNGREFFRGFADDEDTDPKELIVFPGSEAEVTVEETDRYGVKHKNSGEIVALNTACFPSVNSWDEFFDQLSENPFTFCIFAHPQIVGYSAAGIWNFCLEKNNDSRFTDRFRLIETGDGSERQSNLINEYTYSVALDNGFHVSPTCSSDSHGPAWGYYRFPGKTVIMAPEKSKEAFYDAILNNRVYASSGGNVKLYWEVNGCAAPATLPLTDHYHFHVEIDYFEKKKTDEIETCQVISDHGKVLLEWECAGQSVLDFDIDSDSAHYFYLRLTDLSCKKTWSCPVFTGREKETPDPSPLEAIPKEGVTAVDLESGEDASVLFNDDPASFFRSVNATCTILADLHRAETVAAFSHYPKMLSQAAIRAEGLYPPARIAFLPHTFRLSASLDGENFTVLEEGVFRVYGGEEFFRFPETKARFFKLEILKTVGKASMDDKQFPFARVDMAELTFWKKG